MGLVNTQLLIHHTMSQSVALVGPNSGPGIGQLHIWEIPYDFGAITIVGLIWAIQDQWSLNKIWISNQKIVSALLSKQKA